jgi:hypothetical protein
MATVYKADQDLKLELPDEGQVFRATGDVNGDAVYKIVNGQLTTLYSPSYTANTRYSAGGKVYNPGDTTENFRDVQWLDPSYRGTATSRTNAFDAYNKATGQSADSLAQFNMGDLYTGIGLLKQHGASYGDYGVPVDKSIQGYVNPNAAMQVPGAALAAPSPFGENVPALPGSYKAPAAIGSANMAGVANTTYSTPVTTPAYIPKNGSYEPPTVALGPQDTKLSELTKRITSLNDEFSGKSAYQNEQNSAFGVDKAQAVKNSLVAQRQKILNDHAAAQLATQQGQGVTTAVDQRQRAEETRKAAIQELAVSSLIAGADGDLANAQLLADKAVKLKFDPIEAKIKAGLDNLNLIKNDPTTTAEEKARADTMTASLEAYKASLTQQRSVAEDVSKIATTAASYIGNFVATQAYPTAAQAIQAIQKAPDTVTAQTIATQTGLVSPVAKNLPASAQEYEYAKSQGYTGTYQQYQNEDANRKAKAAGGSTSITPTQFNTGAVKAGLDTQTFATLNPEVQNFYAHASADNLKQLQAVVSLVRTGASSTPEVSSQIDTLPLAPAVKDYFKQLVAAAAPAAAPQQQQSTSVLSSIWNGIKSFF